MTLKWAASSIRSVRSTSMCFRSGFFDSKSLKYFAVWTQIEQTSVENCNRVAFLPKLVTGLPALEALSLPRSTISPERTSLARPVLARHQNPAVRATSTSAAIMAIRKSKASSIRLVFGPPVLNLYTRWIMPDLGYFFGSRWALPALGWVLGKLVKCPK